MKALIFVNSGTFSSIEDAANGELAVNWWDDNDEKQVYCTECHAAVEIQNHFEQAGFDISFGCNLECDADLNIIIGAVMIKKLGFSYSQAAKDGSYKVVEKEDKLYCLIWGNNGGGTLNAAHMWLHSLGFRWYTPDDDVSYIPSNINIEKCSCDLSFDYETRACYNEFIDDDNPGFLIWASRNCMNMLRVNRFKKPHFVKKLGLSIMGGGHEIFYRYLNPNATCKSESSESTELTYFEAHPEWFALIDGKRSNRDENKKATEGYYTGDNICTSNPQAVAELARNMLESFADGDYKHLDYLNLWAYDNGTWCSCEECQEVGNLSRRMLMLGYEINKHFIKAYNENRIGRRIRLVVPVYHETLEPPNKPLPDDFDYEHIIATFFPIERCYAHNINDPDCTEANHRLMRLYEKWTDKENGNYKGSIFIGEYYNVSSFASLPFVFINTMINDIPYYYRTGTRHLYYMHISACKWGMLALNNNVLASLMMDVSFDENAWLDEFYNNYYPETGIDMRKFHELLVSASSNAKYLKHYQFNKNGEIYSLMRTRRDAEKFPLTHCKFDYMEDDKNASLSFVDTIEVFEKARKVILEVRNIAQGIEKERVDIEFMRFEYGYKVMHFVFNFIKLCKAFDKGDKKEMRFLIDILDDMCSDLIQITEPLEEMKYECPWYINAFEATWHADAYNEIRAEITMVSDV